MTKMNIAVYLLFYNAGYTLCYVNVALNKPTWQSHQYIPGNTLFSSSNAVDGQKSDLRIWAGQCVTSADGYRSATWWVNLTSIYSIHDIRIYYRTDNSVWNASNGYTARFLGFYVYVSNTTVRLNGHLCFHDTYYTRSTIPAIANITCPVHGQYVIYYNERLSNVTYPDEYSIYAHNELCEVEVYGCQTGFYGSNCSLPCPENCRYCHIETGACTWCKPGYQGYQCDGECDSGRYGQDCGESCGACLGYKQCHHINGSCFEGCGIGYEGDLCRTECSIGRFGKNCGKFCSEHCGVSNICNGRTGECEKGCQPGWKGLQCTKECDGSKYGQGCGISCGACLGYKQCHHLNGSCPEGCDAGFMGELCKTSCSSGTFGINCAENCNENCGISTECNRGTGECDGGCRPGWEGLQCKQACRENKYGKNCSYACGFCQDFPCHHVNGSCEGACLKGYKGTLCNEVCNKGFYGYNCNEECSLFCKTSRDCHHVTGHCKEGCIGGWQGVKCLQVADKTDDMNNLPRFYGVLAALCICIAIIMVMFTYIIINRKRVRRRYEKQRFKGENETKAGGLELYNVSRKKDDDDGNKYQELGEVVAPSEYEDFQ